MSVPGAVVCVWRCQWRGVRVYVYAVARADACPYTSQRGRGGRVYLAVGPFAELGLLVRLRPRGLPGTGAHTRRRLHPG